MCFLVIPKLGEFREMVLWNWEAGSLRVRFFSKQKTKKMPAKHLIVLSSLWDPRYWFCFLIKDTLLWRYPQWSVSSGAKKARCSTRCNSKIKVSSILTCIYTMASITVPPSSFPYYNTPCRYCVYRQTHHLYHHTHLSIARRNTSTSKNLTSKPHHCPHNL